MKVRKGGGEEIPLVQVKEQWLHFAGASVKRYPMSKEWWLHRRKRAERRYSTFKFRKGGHEEILLVQGKEQWLLFAGATVKEYPPSKVRETQVRQ